MKGNLEWQLMANLVTFFVTRAVHLELIEELCTAQFINALRRFVVLRGHVTQFRSDCGTNFVGTVNELGIPAEIV